MKVLLRTLYFMKPYKGRAAFAVLLGFCTIAANIGLMGTSGYLIASAALRPESVLLIWLPIVGVRFFGLSRAVFRYFERLVSHDLTFRILKDVRVWLFGRLERRGERLLEKERSGDLLGSVVSDVDTLQNLYLRVIAPPAVALIVGISSVIVMASFSRQAALMLGVMLVIAGLVIPWASFKAGRGAGRQLVHERAKLYEMTSDMMLGMRELAAFGAVEENIKQLELTQRQVDRYQSAMNRSGAFFGGLTLGTSRLAMLLVLLASIPMVASGSLRGVMLPALALMAAASFEAVSPLPSALQHLGQTLAAGSRLFRLADEAPAQMIEGEAARSGVEAAAESPERTGTVMVQRGTSRGSGETAVAMSGARAVEVGMQNVQSHMAFSFEDVDLLHDDGREALRGLSFALHKGEHAALVGESGSGKSSIVQILLRLQPYSSGSVRLFGQELAGLPEESVRDMFAVVPQHVQLFNATVAANLRIAKPDATDEELKAAARLACADEMISALPQGYNTVIGEWGERLSGGERQRIGLARALLKNAPIVLLDEPAAGLDVLTEEAFVRNMTSALKDKTVLWISHRLQGLDAMDRILVLRDGQLCEQGSHEELMSGQGVYRRLREFQNKEVS
ncbi:thiol reductant ABC exporter subunit CydC [Paenibacillus beijingensis]|uniref:thiol reductant ABC exporter subunit CydC n=1 Tax=Paenibacillus beijingensis TaxID=1126833 RepID=UPI0006982B48|nr:thiol reductant ABC exporter subunit CydC [Paenibacillus beijingensis]